MCVSFNRRYISILSFSLFRSFPSNCIHQPPVAPPLRLPPTANSALPSGSNLNATPPSREQPSATAPISFASIDAAPLFGRSRSATTRLPYAAIRTASPVHHGTRRLSPFRLARHRAQLGFFKDKYLCYKLLKKLLKSIIAPTDNLSRAPAPWLPLSELQVWFVAILTKRKCCQIPSGSGKRHGIGGIKISRVSSGFDAHSPHLFASEASYICCPCVHPVIASAALTVLTDGEAEELAANHTIYVGEATRDD
ncbi:hypothetical protein ACS0TY_031434 [Phlomoides rotata]